jgi:CRP-like cAMP-binding protein
MNDLVKHLSSYCEITAEDERALIELALVKSFQKNQVLLKEGRLSKECFFVLKGSIRSYYIKDNEERTTDLFFEGDVVSPACYGTTVASDYYLQCLEDTVACVGTPELEAMAYEKCPSLERIGRLMADALLTKANRNMDLFKLSSPEERYQNLFETRPEILQRVNQYQIASYLGIKAESLSRIKMRIHQKKVS